MNLNEARTAMTEAQRAVQAATRYRTALEDVIDEAPAGTPLNPLLDALRHAERAYAEAAGIRDAAVDRARETAEKSKTAVLAHGKTFVLRPQHDVNDSWTVSVDGTEIGRLFAWGTGRDRDWTPARPGPRNGTMHALPTRSAALRYLLDGA